MQKKLIALAVAGLVSAPAFAQSNVTVYGLVDMGYVNQGKSNPVTGVASSRTRNAIDSGLQSGSRLGFRGTEDIGNGLKASFVLEMGINVDTGASGQGATFGRQAFAALSGNFGTVAAGRQYSPQFNLWSAIDPFGAGFNGVATAAQGVRDPYSLTGPSGRLNNLVAYVSPDFNGLTVSAGFSWNPLADEGPGVRTPSADDGRQKLWTVSPTYKNGPIVVGVNYHQLNNTFNSPAGDRKTNTWDLGASYDLGAVKLAAMYGRDDANTAQAAAATDNVDERKKWMVGATVPVSAAGKVLASYKRQTAERTGVLSDLKANQWSVGYTHDLSKRTNLYTAYSRVNTNSAADGLFSVSNDAVGSYERGFAVGLRHRF